MQTLQSQRSESLGEKTFKEEKKVKVVGKNFKQRNGRRERERTWKRQVRIVVKFNLNILYPNLFS